MFIKIYNILVSFLGESKQGYYDQSVYQYQFNCHGECFDDNGGQPDGKYNLEVNLQIGKFHCWKCGEMGNLSRLVKKYGGNELFKQYLDTVKDLKEARYIDMDLFRDNGSVQTLDNEALALPKTFRKIDLSKCKYKLLLDYLAKRKIDQEIIDRYNIGYTTKNEEQPSMRNRIIIPSYNSVGDLNYWVGRDFTGNDKRMKYWNSKMDKNSIIYQESHISWDADIYLCEGVVDSIYYPNSIALMGKVLSKDSELFKKLKERANANIIICLDSDTDISETKRIYKMLNCGRLRGKIRYIRMSKYKDFGETYEAEGKKGMIELFKTQQEFNEIDLIF